MILFADVITKENCKSRIIIYEGEDLDEVTNRFAKEHNLDDEKKDQLLLGIHDLLKQV